MDAPPILGIGGGNPDIGPGSPGVGAMPACGGMPGGGGASDCGGIPGICGIPGIWAGIDALPGVLPAEAIGCDIAICSI